MEENIELVNMSNNLFQAPETTENEIYHTNVRRHHRTTSVHRNIDNIQSRTLPRDLEQRRNWLTYDSMFVLYYLLY